MDFFPSLLGIRIMLIKGVKIQHELTQTDFKFFVK